MGNYKFYTPSMLAEYLIDMLPQRKYKRIIDICCGSWNLLEAAKKRFGEAEYVGVDVDPTAKERCFKNAEFICEDGRKYAVNEKKRYDLILSNPPFGHLSDEERFLNNEEKSVICELNNKRYENEMLHANLLLAADNAVFLFILPSTFLEGETYLTIRKELCKKYTISSIIKLPIETFGNNKINTYALIMHNSGMQSRGAEFEKIIYHDSKWIVEKAGRINLNNMKNGEWVNCVYDVSEIRNRLQVYRGNISSAQFSERGSKVFHNSSVIENGIWKPSVRYCQDEKYLEKAKMVWPGDIIINRVGRFAKYWCISEECGFVSDCLIVIRENQNSEIFNKLQKHSNNNRLNIQTKGVSTKYITMRDVLSLL